MAAREGKEHVLLGDGTRVNGYRWAGEGVDGE